MISVFAKGALTDSIKEHKGERWDLEGVREGVGEEAVEPMRGPRREDIEALFADFNHFLWL